MTVGEGNIEDDGRVAGDIVDVTGRRVDVHHLPVAPDTVTYATSIVRHGPDIRFDRISRLFLLNYRISGIHS